MERAAATVEAHSGEAFREATIMVLYVSVVEIAELAALPGGGHGGGDVTGPVGAELLAILWGTAIGLALAHWFAFRLAAPAFRGEHIDANETRVVLAQLAGAAFVAAVSSLPVLLFSEEREQEAVRYVPAILIGFVGYFVARRAGNSRAAAMVYGATGLALGVLVALLKHELAAH
jgi:hypothetical protein